MFKKFLLILILMPLNAFAQQERFTGSIHFDQEYKIQNNLPALESAFIDLHYSIEYVPLGLLRERDVIIKKAAAGTVQKTIGYQTPPESYEILLSTGKAVSKGNPSANIKTLLAQNPNNRDLLFAYAIQLKNENNLNKALEIADRAAEIDPDCALYHFLRGDILRKMERFKEAADEYIYTAQINPYCADAYYNIAKILELIDDKELALEYYKIAYQINPDDIEIREIILDSYMNL